MAITKAFDYKPANYIATFGWQKEAVCLILVYNENHEFQFADLESGRLFNMVFQTPEKAEEWLLSVAQVHEKNAICTTYVP